MQKLGKEANCTDCHGNIGPDHRDGASTVTKFSDAQSQAGTGKTHLSTDAILQANNTCMDCHSSENLREASWTTMCTPKTSLAQTATHCMPPMPKCSPMSASSW